MNTPTLTHNKHRLTSPRAAGGNEAGTQLNKFLAHTGVASRRACEALIREGRVRVNGHKITDPGHRVTQSDVVKVGSKRVGIPQKKVYYLLNKPANCLSTCVSHDNRRTVLDILGVRPDERVYPVGRLDQNTTGLLLLTNDGELAHKLAHPSFEMKKVYRVLINRDFDPRDEQRLLKGVRLEDGVARVDAISFLPARGRVQDRTKITLTLHSGKYRIIRRMLEHLGYRVYALDRVRYAGLTQKGIRVGSWRRLSKQEVEQLYKRVA